MSDEAPHGQVPPGGSVRPHEKDRSGSRRTAGALAVAVLLPVGFVTLLRLIDVPGSIPDIVVAFTPYCVLGALLAGTLALIGRSLRAGIVSGVLLVTHVLWLAPMYVPDGPVARGPSTTVMSINVQYGRGDPDQVVDLVRDKDVEILAVQELTPRAVRALRGAGLDELLPHNHLEPVPGSAGGAGIWSAHPLTPTRFGNQRPMAFENLRATVTIGGRVEVDFLAVHPFPPQPLTSVRWRRDIAEVVRAGVPSDRPMIIAGDFNATRDHGPMRKLAGQGLVDAADRAGAGYVPTWSPGGFLPPLFEIDHVLVSAGVGVSSVSRHMIDGSDHKAVVAELTIAASGPPRRSP